jgi:hypothetical protein
MQAAESPEEGFGAQPTNYSKKLIAMRAVRSLKKDWRAAS